MKLRLKEKTPMFKDEFGTGEPIWFEAGEEFEVIESKIIKPDSRAWFKVKSKWFTQPMKGFHNPDNFELLGEAK